MSKITTETRLRLINDLVDLGTVSSSDLFFIQKSLKSYKLSYSDLVAGLPDDNTIEVNSDKLSVNLDNIVDDTTIEVSNSDKLQISETYVDSIMLNLLERVYPVGSIYCNYSNGTDPSDPSLLGFGTWEAIGQGRVLMGSGESTPDDNGETITVTTSVPEGGQKNVTLNINQIPEHHHRLARWAQASNDNYLSGNEYLSGRSDFSSGNSDYDLFGTTSTPNVGMTGDVITQSGAETNTGQSHTNVQPYRVVWMWQRTP
jgi:microcystin-dependent protein